MKKTKLGQDLIAALGEAIDYHQGKIDLRTTEFELPNEPKKLTTSAIRSIRSKLNLSQPVFAKYLGVSDKAVKAWEQGLSTPSGAAARLLEIAQKNVNIFKKLVMISSN
jgi:putative transcriptional regulator